MSGRELGPVWKVFAAGLASVWFRSGRMGQQALLLSSLWQPRYNARLHEWKRVKTQLVQPV